MNALYVHVYIFSKMISSLYANFHYISAILLINQLLTTVFSEDVGGHGSRHFTTFCCPK